MVRPTQVTTNTKETEYLIVLPYKGKVGKTRLKSLRETWKSAILANDTCKIIYAGTKF